MRPRPVKKFRTSKGTTASLGLVKDAEDGWCVELSVRKKGTRASIQSNDTEDLASLYASFDWTHSPSPTVKRFLAELKRLTARVAR